MYSPRIDATVIKLFAAAQTFCSKTRFYYTQRVENYNASTSTDRQQIFPIERFCLREKTSKTICFELCFVYGIGSGRVDQFNCVLTTTYIVPFLIFTIPRVCKYVDSLGICSCIFMFWYYFYRCTSDVCVYVCGKNIREQ